MIVKKKGILKTGIYKIHTKYGEFPDYKVVGEIYPAHKSVFRTNYDSRGRFINHVYSYNPGYITNWKPETFMKRWIDFSKTLIVKTKQDTQLSILMSDVVGVELVEIKEEEAEYEVFE